eukprot:1379092-Ditylum_brightwellii.AAC.1
MGSTCSTVQYADKGKQVNFMIPLQIPSSWPNCPKNIPRDYALEEPKQAKKWRTVDTPNESAKYLMLRNKHHFGQAHGTMFTVSPLLHEMDWGANILFV